VGLELFEGREVDEANGCLKAAVPLSCTDSVTGAETCWKDTNTSQIYRLLGGPCMPDPKWRECTNNENLATAEVVASCE
jgi:hypothetical protein